MTNHPLRKYRERNEITLQELALKAGTSVPSLCRIERRQQTPSLALVARLIKACKGAVTAHDFFEEDAR
jgi:transcriptional regulator with XRE-family HTH domain